jgi:MFS family permease
VKNNSKNVLYLGLVSLFTDLSSQMVYPLIPEFLVTIGANKSIIGIIEGIAECTASLFRTVFGKWSDSVKRRKIFIFCGYSLSALSRPFLYLAQQWTVVLGVKFSDRLGKAIRTPARDALISSSITSSKRGKAFGFHRAMDKIGAVGGPLLALLILQQCDNNVRLVFLLSVIPAILALLFIFFAKEASSVLLPENGQQKQIKNRYFIHFLIAITIFTFGNSSNAFLILKARDVGLEIYLIPLIWMVYNIFGSFSSPIFGSLSDRVGRKAIILISFLYYSLIYLLFGLTENLLVVWLLFAAYGIYYGLSDGVFRAYIADIVTENHRATAYGIFNTTIGLALLPASLITGAIWDLYGSKWAFLTSAFLSFFGFLIMLTINIFINTTSKVT